jgi:hypothetical protein
VRDNRINEMQEKDAFEGSISLWREKDVMTTGGVGFKAI